MPQDLLELVIESASEKMRRLANSVVNTRMCRFVDGKLGAVSSGTPNRAVSGSGLRLKPKNCPNCVKYFTPEIS